MEVLVVEEDAFNEILRDYMTAQYNMKMTAIDAFPYFKYLDQTQVCIRALTENQNK